MSVHWPIIRRCLLDPMSRAVVDDTRTYRRIDLLVAALNLAGVIESRTHTQTVGVLLPTGGGFLVAAVAGWIAGKTVVPLNYLLKEGELRYVIDDCGTDTVLTAQGMLDYLKFEPVVKNLLRVEQQPLRSVPPPRWPAGARDEDLAVLLYTSGTSGRPKGVMLTHGNLCANIAQVSERASFGRRDTLLGVLPQFHSFGLTVLSLVPLTVGCKVVYTARFVPHKIIKLLREHRPTALIAIPSMYGALMSVKDGGPDDFASLRFVVSGGEPLPESVSRGFRARFGVTINEGYGLTETSPVTNWCIPSQFRAGSVGPALRGIDQTIVNLETGADACAGGEGEVRVSGPNIMRGYFGLDEETRAAFDERGRFRTGDIGKLDGDGHLYITGRLKEMLIVGGENVFPREIEEVLCTYPGVTGAGVVGESDPVRGEVPVAFIEMDEAGRGSFNEAAVIAHCKASLAGYKVPRDVRLLDSLPRNPTGKIMRRELKAILKAEDRSAAH